MLKKLTKILLVFVMALQILTPSLTVNANEGNSPTQTTLWHVTVQGGTGSRTDVQADETVTVVATAPSGYRFVRWESVGEPTVNFAHATSPTTTFEMPAADVTVRAVFEPIPTFTLTVVNGRTGSASDPGPTSIQAPAGQRIDIAAAHRAGYAFTHWTSTAGVIETPNNRYTTFTMPAQPATVTAHFEPIAAPTFTAIVEGGTGGGRFEAGTTVSIRATVPVGYRFVHWESVGAPTTLNFANPAAENTTFVMQSSDVTVRAVFESTSITHNVRNIAVMNRTMPLRSGPGANTVSQGNINQGTRLLIIGESANGTWVQVQAGTRTGWVNRMRVNNFRVNAVANTGVILRTGPGTNFGQNGNVSRGANVSVIARSGEWSNIQIGNRNGWVRTERLDEIANVAVMNHSVPLRSGPSANHASLGNLTRGTRVTVVGTSANGQWTRIRVGNNTGWVNSTRLNDLRLFATSTAAVPLRGGAGSNFAQIGSVPRGANLRFLGQSGDWARVQVGSNVGWIRTERMSAVVQTRRVTATVPLRGGPGSDFAQVRNVPNNAQVTVFGTSRSGEWSHIRIGNDVGWIRTNRLR